MFPFNKWLNFSSSIIFFSLLVLSYATSISERFEYKYSFKPPYLAQKDGSVPFWEYGGNCIASLENVRVAPSLRSQKGAIWTKTKTNFEWWSVDIVFRVTGRGRIGADGLAFWYTADKGNYDGEVFGSSDKWNGLGLFFDSFDNDNNHNNPYIMAVKNDGNMAFDHQNDGVSQALAGCLRDFRNKPFPTKAKIQYYMNTLTVWFHNGMTNNPQDIEVCLRVEHIYLPREGYFGISAATGGLADDHDVLHFHTTSLYPPGAQVPQQQMNVNEQQKLTQEYADYEKKLEEQKQQYQLDHPDATKQPDDEWYESDNQRELRQIFQGQSQIAEWTKDIANNLNTLQQKQDRILAIVGQNSGVPQVPGQPVPLLNNDAIIASQNSLLSTVQELRNYVVEINQKSENIQRNMGRTTPVGYDQVSIMNEVRDGLHHMKQAALIKPECPNTCISMTLFITFVIMQTLVLIGYMIYRDKTSSSPKKFY